MITTENQQLSDISLPAISRLCMVYELCESHEALGETELSSQEMAARLGVAAHNIRKDISCLGEVGTTGSGYNVTALKKHIAGRLGLDRKRNACVVGLGRLGSAIIEFQPLFASGCAIVAGFDSNINRIETITTKVAVYPSNEIGDIVRRDSIEIGIIAVPALSAAATAADLIEAGIVGIINFAPVVIASHRRGVVVRNVDIVNEFRITASLLSIGAATMAHND